jgi:Carbohydrate family 9 binding domain-like
MALLVGGAFLPAAASVSHTTVIAAVKAEKPVTLDAALVDPEWQSATRATGFMNFTVLRPASLETVAYVLYDDRNLYVAFHCVQRGIPILATQTVDHAGVSTDDHVTIWIDTSGNGSRTYSFSVNPRGVSSETSSENARYAPSWRAIARISDGSYNVMMEIPLAVLRAQSGVSATWRINFERYIAESNDDYTWAFEPAQTAVSNPQNWPRFTGIRISSAATRPKPHADAYALDSAGSQHNVFQNGIGQFEPTSPRVVGVDATYPFTNTLAFVGTIDPDFSNVEEDQTTIQPQEFAKVYTEYRPFFAQGAQYINAVPQVSLLSGSGNTMLYTPSIGIFNSGFKVEGTSGQNAIGLLNTTGPGFNDSAYGYAYTRPDNSFSLSTEGVLLSQNGVRDDTFGFGVTQTNPHSGQFTDALLATESGTLISASGTSQSVTVAEGLHDQHWLLQGIYNDIGPEYAPLDGYTAINDIRGPGAIAEYFGFGSPKSAIQSYQFFIFGDHYFDRSGNVREADANAFYSLTFKNLITVSGFFGPSELRSYTQGYPVYSGGQTDWYNRRQIALGYKVNSPSPVNISYTWGPFAGYYVQQTASSLSEVFGAYAFTLEYDGNIERTGPGAPIFNSQWLRRLSFSRSFGRNATIALAYRDINGTGGLAQPGSNLALLYEQRFVNQDMLYLEYGTPAAVQTLHRFIVKYVVHVGGGTGT